MEAPLVSISCVSYNHATFIRHCLDGMLMQKTSFPIEILIHDDCSTDGTTEIIKEYEAKYPSLIFALYENENQYSKGAWVDGFNYRRAKGKYIAYCEGDDYWTDPLKLQKQVDFMESHTDYSVCFHAFRNHVVSTDEYRVTTPTRLLQSKGDSDGIDVDLNLYFNAWYTQPMTMLFRRSVYDLTWRNQYQYYRDQHEIYHLLKVGKGRLLNFDGGVRNVHAGGIASVICDSKQIVVSMNISKELYVNNQDGPTQKFYADTLQWALYRTKRFSKERWMYSFRLFGVDKNFVQLLRNLKRK